MKKIVFLILVLISNFAFSQSPSTIWAVPNNSASFTITMAKNSLCFQKDSAFLWRIDTVAASSQTLANTSKTLVGGGSSGGGYWTLTGNYLYPTAIDDSIGIGTTTPVAKLDVLGSFKFVTDSGYNLITGNPFGRTIITNGSYFYKSDAPSGGYFYNGITELLNGEKSSSLYWTNDTFGILKYNRVVVDNEEVNMYVVGPGYAYAADINKGFGFDYMMLRDTLQYSALQMFQGDSVCVNNEPSSIEMRSDIFKFTVNKQRENSLYLSGKGIYLISPSGGDIFRFDTTKHNYIGEKIIGHTNADSLLKINGIWYNRYDSITISASVDSSIFATKSYTLNNFKGRGDSLISSGFLTRHQAALSYAPISVVNYFSKTGRNIYPTTANNKLMIGSITLSDTSANTGLYVKDGGLTVSGTTGETPLSGAGTRLMWIPAKAAFRGGAVTGTNWDAANIGQGSFAYGNAKSSGVTSIAMGDECVASGYSGAVALGYGATASQSHSIALGYYNIASGQYTFATNGRTTAQAPYSAAFGSHNVVNGSTTAVASYDAILTVGNGTGTGANANNALTLRRNGFLGLNVGDTSAYPRAHLQINVKSNKYTNRNIFHFVDNVRNQKINTLAQVRDTSCYYGAFTSTGKFQLFNVDNNGTLTALLDSTGEFTSKITHAFFNTTDTTYTPAVTQNVYTTLVFPKIDEFVNFTKTGDSLIIGKSGSYYFTFNWTMQGANGEDYKMAVFYNGTLIATATQTTTGATNFQGQSMQGYIDNAAVGDRITLRITNLTNNGDPTLRQGSFYIRREY